MGFGHGSLCLSCFSQEDPTAPTIPPGMLQEDGAGDVCLLAICQASRQKGHDQGPFAIPLFPLPFIFSDGTGFTF